MSNMYESGSLPSHFKPHQQGPKPLPKSAFSTATMPDKEIVQKRPNYVVINNVGAEGTYAFLTTTTASVGGTTTAETYVSGAYVSVAAQSVIRLDINPVAWRRTDTTGQIGDVSFVYKGGL